MAYNITASPQKRLSKDLSAILFVAEWLRECDIRVQKIISFLEVGTFVEHYPLPIADQPVSHLAPHVSCRIVRVILVVGYTDTQALLYTGVEAIPHAAHLENQEVRPLYKRPAKLIWQATKSNGKRPVAFAGNPYLLQLPSPMCLQVLLHAGPLFFTPEPVAVCHQARGKPPLQRLGRSTHGDAFTPWLTGICSRAAPGTAGPGSTYTSGLSYSSSIASIRDSTSLFP